LRNENSNAGDGFYITFIGTGFSYNGNANMARNVHHKTNVAQNLPYGTHIVSVLRTSSSSCAEIKIDGVSVITTVSGTNDELAGIEEATFHQPKMPPIPEDAVVIADYMLMADFVSLGASNNNDKRLHISKGVRRISSSRDVLYDNSAWTETLGPSNIGGFAYHGADNDYTAQAKITFFGDKVVWYYGDPVTRFVDGTCTFSSGTKGTTVDISSTNDSTIGAREFNITDGSTSTTFTGDSTGASNSYTTKNGLVALDLHTPIHTSSHYQTFETPFLHELVGGDRNMEQNNLVVTPDGKTWDEVTRDVSYIGNMMCSMTTDTSVSWATAIVFDEWRGHGASAGTFFRDQFNKDFAIARDRIICLVDGQYALCAVNYNDGGTQGWSINGVTVVYHTSTNANAAGGRVLVHLNRGDYVQLLGEWGYDQVGRHQAWIERLN
jgi:hypothetical protein